MSTNPNYDQPFGDFGRRVNQGIDGAARKIEQEGERVINYLNDEVVPAIRNHSSKALRKAAEQLNRLAEHMDKAARG